jgi:hypothetical protein
MIRIRRLKQLILVLIGEGGERHWSTYIDHKNDTVKEAWIKRHQVNGCCMLSRPRLCSRSGALPATCAPSYTSLPPSLLPRGWPGFRCTRAMTIHLYASSLCLGHLKIIWVFQVWRDVYYGIRKLWERESQNISVGLIWNKHYRILLQNDLFLY